MTIHNLHGVWKDLTITKRDHDSDMASFERQFEHYRILELELADEKEKTLTLEAQLARSRDQFIEDCKKS